MPYHDVDCQEFAERLQAVLDERGAPTGDPGLTAHAAGCESCRNLLASMGELCAALPSLRVAPPSDDWTRRTIAAAVAALSDVPADHTSADSAGGVTIARRSNSPWYASYGMFAAAACLLLAAWPAFQWWVASREHDSVRSPIAAAGPHTATATATVSIAPTPTATPHTTPSMTASATLPEDAESWSALALETQKSYVDLADDMRRSLDDVWSVASILQSDVVDEPTPMPSDSNWLDDVGDGLKPLSDSTIGTLDLFRSVVPLETNTRS